MSIRIGLVGAGFIAGRHVDSLTDIDGVSVVGVADPQRDRAARLADRIEDAGLLAAVEYHRRYPDTLQHARQLLAEAPARMVLSAWLDKAPRVDRWVRPDRSGQRTIDRSVDPIAAEDRVLVDATTVDRTADAAAGVLR